MRAAVQLHNKTQQAVVVRWLILHFETHNLCQHRTRLAGACLQESFKVIMNVCGVNCTTTTGQELEKEKGEKGEMGE